VQSFQQLQIYLKDGMSVTRLEDGVYGPTNNFADVVYYLLTQVGSSIGQEISERLIDRDSFVQTARFLRQMRVRFDGAITDYTNLRTYITQLAPLFLCNFVIKNGKFALVPAVPVRSDGELDTGPVPISQIFTDGNIIDGSFEFTYLEQTDRQDFRAIVNYRDTEVNGLTEEKTILVKWKEEGAVPPAQENIDMSQFCTRRGHAFLAARYLISIRRRIDHIIKFQTVIDGLSLGPGDYIRVNLTASPYESSQNVVVLEDLALFTPATIEDGTYTAFVYRQGSETVVEEQITIENNRVTDPTLANALLNIPTITRRWGVYMVDKLDITEEGLVDITASHFPVFADLRSKIVDDILHANRFVKFELIE
jgi:predicted phage tail protein